MVRELWQILMIAFLVGSFAIMALGIGADFGRSADPLILPADVEFLTLDAGDVLPPECRQGVGIAWRDPAAERTETFGIWPCSDEEWVFRYQEWRSYETVWYSQKLREHWYTAPRSVAAEMRKVFIYARDMRPIETPTPEVGDE